MEYLKLKRGETIDAVVKTCTPRDVEKEFNGNITIQKAYDFYVNDRVCTLSVSPSSGVIRDMEKFQSGSRVTVAHERIGDNRSTYRVHARGDIQVQPQNQNLPTGKENWENHVQTVRVEDKELETQKRIARGNCINAASRIIAAKIIKGKEGDAIKAIFDLTNALCLKFHPDLFGAKAFEQEVINQSPEDNIFPDSEF
ncbi:MAG: hypothetical protein ACFFDI_21425 [Promethearchaeota archaeon]